MSELMNKSQSDLSADAMIVENDFHSPYKNKGMHLMQNMGYRLGDGLGKEGEGIKEPIKVVFHNNTSGLGFIQKDNFDNFEEEIEVEEKLDWLQNDDSTLFLANDQLKSFLKIGNPSEYSISHDFCDKEILDDISRMKDSVFEQFYIEDVNKARARANLFEKIRSVFFMNRAALKLANIDAATNFMFSNINENEHHCNSNGPFYFADVCAGPGGFSEYILWRKGWLFKGFGLTLKGENDFKLNESCCISPHSFQAFYGSAGDGDVCNPENIKDFKEKVLFQTNGLGVHFMTSDGGFCVEGEENLQEILSKNIYLCQCLVALEIVRSHGHFVTKLFDVFTPFSVGLIYLMYKCFEKVCILKPKSSRPANAERYLICCNLQDNAEKTKIKKYLQSVSRILWEKKDDKSCDVLEIVSLENIKADRTFIEYIRKSNNKIGRSQIDALHKLELYCQIRALTEQPRQHYLRNKALKYWKIPANINKMDLKRKMIDDDNELYSSLENLGWLKNPSMDAKNKNSLERIYTETQYISCCMLYSSKKQVCNLFAGFSSDTRKWENGSWVIEKSLKLTKGTLLYGEIVKETLESKDNPCCKRSSLHIIDAIYLGDKDMRNLPFEERMRQISVYAQSINAEFQEKLLRIRKKMFYGVKDAFFSEKLIRNIDKKFYIDLPILGFKSTREYHRVKNILFFKNSDSRTTFFSRIHLSLKGKENLKLYSSLIKKLKSNV